MNKNQSFRYDYECSATMLILCPSLFGEYKVDEVIQKFFPVFYEHFLLSLTKQKQEKYKWGVEYFNNVKPFDKRSTVEKMAVMLLPSIRKRLCLSKKILRTMYREQFTQLLWLSKNENVENLISLDLTSYYFGLDSEEVRKIIYECSAYLKVENQIKLIEIDSWLS